MRDGLLCGVTNDAQTKKRDTDFLGDAGDSGAFHIDSQTLGSSEERLFAITGQYFL